MNILIKAIKFDIYNLVTLKMLYKVNKIWWISYEDFCKLDKWTKRSLGEAGVQVTRPAK